MTPTVVFYALLVLGTVYNAWKAISLKGKHLEKATVYELTDRASWVVGGVLLALVPLWWNWPSSSYIGAVMVSVIGLIVSAGFAQLLLGEILSARSLGHAIYRLFLVGVLLVLVFLAFRVAMWVIRTVF